MFKFLYKTWQNLDRVSQICQVKLSGNEETFRVTKRGDIWVDDIRGLAYLQLGPIRNDSHFKIIHILYKFFSSQANGKFPAKRWCGESGTSRNVSLITFVDGVSSRQRWFWGEVGCLQWKVADRRRKR